MSHSRLRRSAAAVVLTILSLAPAIVARAAARTFAWKATGKGGTVYLVGSVHLLSQDFYPLHPALEAAYKDSNLLVEEVDLGEIGEPEQQFSLLSRGMLPSSQSLDTVLTPGTLALLDKRLGDLGALAEPLKRFKPWMAALTIESLEWLKAGFDPNFGLDKHFYDRAKSDGKAVEGFETADFQISLFDQMSMSEQDRLLASTLKDVDTEQANMSKLVGAWRNGDAPTVEQIVLSDLKNESALYQRVLVGRNKTWMPKIEALFARNGRALIVVGAAHLVGPDGLLSMLRAKGYTIEQL